MASLLDPVLDSIDSLIAWLGSSVKQTTDTYCDLETAENEKTLVSRDGSLVSVIKIEGVTQLIGNEEFNDIHHGISESLRASLSREGHAFQFFFSYDRKDVENEIADMLAPARSTAKRLNLELNDVFNERISHLGKYCAKESVYLVLWTRPHSLPKEQQKRAMKKKMKDAKDNKIPPMKYSQNITATIPDIRESHDSYTRAVLNDFNELGLLAKHLDVHTAIRDVRMTVDPDYTDKKWKPVLPGDKIPARQYKNEDIAGVLWPSLPRQILPRDAENLSLRTVRIGDRIYSSVFIDLFPQEVQSFSRLFHRALPTQVPWRISYMVESGGLETLRFKSVIASILSWTSAHNKLISNATNMLRNIDVASDDAVVKLRVSLATWAPVDDEPLLRRRTAELAKAVQGWGSCEVGEVSGEAFQGAVSSMLGVTTDSVATASIAPLSDVVTMLPFTRPASSWKHGALMFRTPDGKPWPFQPGSSQQSTWIDLIYARPGSGKSVLSNAINLALCLSGGIKRLPRISIIDIGPSSSGLISLLREALPHEQRHLVAYHRLRMTPDYAINPFDTQLGCRYPTPQERSFLVNFLTLLATPLGAERPYDGIADMVGLVIDELYKSLSDQGNPHAYTKGMDYVVDELLEEIAFVHDSHTTWWEVTDALFAAGFSHEAMLAQRYAMPLLADVTSICRTPAIEDLYSKVTAPTGESIVLTLARMISSAVREYPILSRITRFDLGDAKIVSLDLDEVAKSGGEAAERQTAVMYMLARYIMARHYYLVEDNLDDMPQAYRAYHGERIEEIREDSKRLVYDEFHRTAKTQAVRDQVILDMREGRKWNVQIALLSQSVEDFDPVMIEFATSVFIMDAGPSQAVKKTTEVFGLSDTAQAALKSRVHGPREGGATFLAQFSTKEGVNTQLLTSTIGPIELWAFSTTVEDATLRNKLYQKLGSKEARKLLATLFPTGTVKRIIEDRLVQIKDEKGIIEEVSNLSIVDQLMHAILKEYTVNPDMKTLPDW